MSFEQTIINKIELIPHDGHKSFYRKAFIIETPEMYYCLSYDTIVCGVDKQTKTFCRYWLGYSATTMRHINAFLYALMLPLLNKKEWLKIPV